MTILFEDALTVFFVGVLAEAMLLLTFFYTRRWQTLAGMVAVAIITVGALAVEALVVTDREEIELQLDRGARAFVRGDVDSVLALIAPEALTTRQRVLVVLEHIKFHWIKIRDLEVAVNRLTSPPTAEARFQVFFQFEDRAGVYPYRYDEVGLVLEFILTDQGWRITGHIEVYEVRSLRRQGTF